MSKVPINSKAGRRIVGELTAMNKEAPVDATPPLAADHAQAGEYAVALADADSHRVGVALSMADTANLARAYLAVIGDLADYHASQKMSGRVSRQLAADALAASPGEGREPDSAVVERYARELAAMVDFPNAGWGIYADFLRSFASALRIPPAAPAVGVTITEAMVDAAMEASDVKFRDGGFMRYDRQAIARHLTAALRGTEG